MISAYLEGIDVYCPITEAKIFPIKVYQSTFHLRHQFLRFLLSDLFSHSLSAVKPPIDAGIHRRARTSILKHDGSAGKQLPLKSLQFTGETTPELQTCIPFGTEPTLCSLSLLQSSLLCAPSLLWLIILILPLLLRQSRSVIALWLYVRSILWICNGLDF